MTQITLRGHNDHLPCIRKIRQKVTVSHILVLIARHNNAVGAFHLINGLTDSGSVGTDSDHICNILTIILMICLDYILYNFSYILSLQY